MTVEVKVPQLPESVADATLISWHRKVGDTVRRDENLVDLETDKVVLEVPAPTDGTIKEIKVHDGSTVASGDVLAVLEPGAAGDGDSDSDSDGDSDGEGRRSDAAESTATEGRGTPANSVHAAAATGSGPAAAPTERDDDDDDTAADRGDGTHKMGPAVRKLLDEHDLEPSAIKGSGRDGRITKTDVLDYLNRSRESHIGGDEEGSPGVRDDGAPTARAEQRVPMTRLRARIAERLVTAQQTAAMLTTFNECDMSAVIALRKRYQEQFTARHGIKLGFMSFFVKAAIEALREFPTLNASVDGSDIVYHEYFDIGVAVSTERGLVVPVLRSAEAMGFADIEQAIRELGERAQAGRLEMEDLTGGTFTVTNGGIFGSMMSTPILNPPQSGILGMHSIEERPVVVDGEIVIRPMMYLALTYDHRIVDGREAVQFLVRLKERIEDPARLILQV